MKDYADFVDKLMTHGRVVPDARVMHNILAINSEAGELADAYVRQVGYTELLDQDNVKEELGDILFFVQDLCNIYGWTMGGVIAGNMNKLEKRYPNGEWTPKAAKERADKKPPQEGATEGSDERMKRLLSDPVFIQTGRDLANFLHTLESTSWGKEL
jgi:NTP pyrophosphatase (non-canonical NTP hydrolase)